MAKRKAKRLWVLRSSVGYYRFLLKATRPRLQPDSKHYRGFKSRVDSDYSEQILAVTWEAAFGLKLEVGECKPLNSRTLRALRWAKE